MIPYMAYELARGVNFLKGFRFFAGHPVSTE